MKKIFNAVTIVVLLLMGLPELPAGAADFPTKPITLIIPMSAGGARDIQCRAFATVAERILEKPVVVVNKPGASGMIGMLAGAQAAPDGYTLVGTSTSDTCALEWEMANGRKPPVSRGDFGTLGSFTLSSAIIAVPTNSPWKTLSDLINEVKAKPGRYVFCSGGLYTFTHTAVEIFTRSVGLKARHVPYPAAGPSVSALVGNHADFSSFSVSSVMPLVQGKKLCALAVQSDRRFKHLPDVPCVKELGIDAEFHGWVGIWVPQKTSTPTVEKLREIVKKVTEDPAFIKIIETDEEVHFLNGDELAKYIELESRKVGKLYRELIEEEKGKK